MITLFSIKKGLFSSLLSFALLISIGFPLTVGAETTEATQTPQTTPITETATAEAGEPPSGENVQRNEEEIQIEAETPASVTGEIMQGNGTVVDYTTTGSKQFYTIVDSEQNTFYLVVDMDKTQNNVYFLKSITQAELEGATTNAVTTEVTSPVETPNVEAEVSTPPEEDNSGLGFGLGVLLIAAIGVGAYYFLVMRKRHQNNQIHPNEENEDDLEESYDDDFYEDEDEDENSKR